MSKVIGIDLGTTNSCVAISEGGVTRVLENSEGNRTTPSIVAWKGDEVLVGQTAKNQAVTNPINTINAAKRLIGMRADDSIIKKEQDLVQYKITANAKGDACISVNDKVMEPEQISAHVLMKLKKTAEEYLGQKVTEAVITVPAYFNDQQRQATKDAGKIAGLDVKRIINEPTAAALAYGLDSVKKTDQKVAVYDLGGGTFDISIIEICKVDEEFQFEVLATNGDTHLGGEDFDREIIKDLVATFKSETAIDLSSDVVAMQRLKEAAEKVKIELSSREQSEVNLPFIMAVDGQPKHLVTQVTRAKFEKLVRNLIEKSLRPVEQALADAKLQTSDISEIILVGGQTRMPLVQELVKKFFGKAPRHDVNPDEAVAVGAAIQGAVLSGDRSDVLLLDVTPLTLGVETYGGVMTAIIEKNTTIPISKSQVFSTAENNQPEVSIRVLQGERSKASGNKLLGNFNLTGIPAKPRGIPQIEVTFDIDADGIINVTAKDKDSGKSQSIEVNDVGGLSEEEIQRMIKEAEEHAEEDKTFQETIALKNSTEAIIYSAEQMIEENSEKLDETLVTETKQLLEETKQSLTPDADKAQIEAASTKLSEGLMKLQTAIQALQPEEPVQAPDENPQQPASDQKSKEQVVDIDDKS